jgi:RNA recognition motif-containing protein
MNIYVGNLPYTITDESLKELFVEYGQVDSSKVIMDRHSGRSKGYGFVEMPSNSEADKAIKALNGKLIDGMNIKVNQANPGGKKAKRPAFRNRY